MKKTKFNVVAAVFASIISLYMVYACVAILIYSGFSWEYLLALPMLLLTVALWSGKRNWFTIVSAVAMLLYWTILNINNLINFFSMPIDIPTISVFCSFVAWTLFVVFAIVSACQKQRRPLRYIWYLAPLLASVYPSYYIYLVITQNYGLLPNITVACSHVFILLFASLWLAFPYKKIKSTAAEVVQPPVQEATQQEIVEPVEPALEDCEQLLVDIESAQQDIASTPLELDHPSQRNIAFTLRPEDIYPITNLDGTVAPRPINTAKPVEVLDSKVEKLLLYKDYLYRGIITEKEYAALKKKLIEE